MKICTLTHTFPRFTGDTAAPFMGELTEALAKKNEVIVLAPYDLQFKKRKTGYKLITYKYIFPNFLHKIGYSRTFKSDKAVLFSSYLIAPFMYFFGVIALFKLVKREKIDVISAHWSVPSGFMAAFVGLITKTPYTVTIPGSDMYMGTKNAIFRWMVGFATLSADVVISDSAHYIKQLNDLGYKPEKTLVIRYGVDVSKFKPTGKSTSIMSKLGIKKQDPVILAVGRMVEKKGFIYLLNSMPAILRKFPSAKLILVGDGYERKKLEKQAVKLKIADSVLFAGTIKYSELSKYYNLAEVFVMPSIKDSKGNLDASPVSMMEAMACGSPVVATEFSGSDELIVAGKTGCLVPEKNVKEISASVAKLLGARGRGMRRKVRRVAVSNFSLKVIAQKYNSVFDSIA